MRLAASAVAGRGFGFALADGTLPLAVYDAMARLPEEARPLAYRENEERLWRKVSRGR